MSPATMEREAPETAPSGAGSEPPAPPSRVGRDQRRRRVLVRIAVVLGVLFVLSQLQVHWNTITRIDAPFTLRADKRLAMVSPDPEEEVGLPVTVTWKTVDYELEDGHRFAVFVDKGFPAPRRDVRLTLCSEQGKLPPQPGELRAPCKDDRDRIHFTTDTSLSFDCFEPRFSAGRRRQNEHTVSVILVDENLRRVGEAATAVKFRVDDEDAASCRGF